MTPERYRYRFSADVPLEEVEATILLAIWGTESLHGETQVRLDLDRRLDLPRRTYEVDASTPVGRDFNRLLLGYLQREFGPDAFDVRRATSSTRARRREATRA